MKLEAMLTPTATPTRTLAHLPQQQLLRLRSPPRGQVEALPSTLGTELQVCMATLPRLEPTLFRPLRTWDTSDR